MPCADAVSVRVLRRAAHRVRAIVDGVCKANGATCKLDYVLSYPAIQNSDTLRTLARESAVRAVGREKVFDAPRMSASEDFSYYVEVAPAYFFIVGVGDGPANHNPAFHADDAAMPDGVRAEVQMLWDYLNSRGTR